MNSVRLIITIVTLGAALSASAIESEQDIRNKKQADLDRRCESAREVILAPVRKEIYYECMQASRRTDAAADCERRAADYNANRNGGAPRYYDIQECVTAFEYRQSYGK